jgi:hypothetical protein
MQEPYLVFESSGYHFALPVDVVDNVSNEAHDDSVSFSRCFLGVSQEEETCCIVLRTGKSIKVHGFHEIVSLKETVLPLPGYIFKGDATWVRGLIWSAQPRVIVLNEGFLLEKV